MSATFDRRRAARPRARGGFLGRVALAAALASLAGCEVGPDYQRPPVATPVAYKESKDWKPATPADMVNRGPWWSAYKDPVLDGLERQVDVSNQTLRAAEAAYRQSQAVVAEARSTLFPTVSLSTSVQDTGTGGQSKSSTGFVVGGGARSETFFGLTGAASWAPDLWGQIRRTIESDVASAQVSAADLASARLSAQASLAIDYFELRMADELKRLLDATIVAYKESLRITQNQYRAGTAAQTDVVTAETQVRTTESQAIDVGVQRAQLEHAIAVLIGKPPAELSIAPAATSGYVPVVPTDLPSTLLERRPDIAATERQVAAANAEIGVALSAFFPTLTLSASYGFSGLALGKLVRAPNSAWSLGGDLAETVFDAGLRQAQVAAARAAYDQTVANYRQTVLAGFQQVEDELAALRILERQSGVQDDAVRLSKEAVTLVINQYKAGTVAYTSVITDQAIELGNEEAALTILQNRLVASVTLIEALGGGWSGSDLPSPGQVEEVGAPPPGGPQPVREELPGDRRSWFERFLGL